MNARLVPAFALGHGRLHRAIVSLPAALCDRSRELQERIVFFEARGPQPAHLQLEALLALTWQVDTNGWCEDGYIYNLRSAYELMQEGYGAETTGELRLLETGAGGDWPLALGRDRIHYVRAADVDLFVSPRIAARLHALLDLVEAMRRAESPHRGDEATRLRAVLRLVVADWTQQFERYGHDAPHWARQAREALATP